MAPGNGREGDPKEEYSQVEGARRSEGGPLSDANDSAYGGRKAELRHAFELQRIEAVWKEKERRRLRMQRNHDRSVARMLRTPLLLWTRKERL